MSAIKTTPLNQSSLAVAGAWAWACASVCLLVQPASAQAQQKVSGPLARYWVSAHTASGMAAMQASARSSGGGGGGAAMMAAMAGGDAPAPVKLLSLELGSNQPKNPANGEHLIPAGMAMGASLPLLGERSAPRQGEVERDRLPREVEDGRILFFWGCGDSVGAGQPVVLDTKQMREGRLPPTLKSFSVNSGPVGPLNSADRGYADWLSTRDLRAVPANASLVGDHTVTSTIAPEIRFSVPEGNDFLGALSLNAQSGASGASLTWGTLPQATGYFASAIGASDGKSGGVKQAVFWNSSSVPMYFGYEMSLPLPPAEVARLVRERVVLSPGTTQCTIPKAVLDAAGGSMPMSNLTAFGPEFNHVHPPRPQDLKVEWKQEYAVKVRTVATTSFIEGMGGGSVRSARQGAGGQPGRPAATAQAGNNETAATPPAPQTPAEAMGNAIPNLLPGVAPAVGGLLKGLFGR